MKNRRAALFGLLMLAAAPSFAGFDVIALGVTGGIQDGNLSAWMIRRTGDDRAVICDVGTLVRGLQVADSRRALARLSYPGSDSRSRVEYVLTEHVKGYLVSHAHLDHVAGLLIASPDDVTKPIYALRSVNDELVRSYFNSRAWANFSDRGEAALNKYHLEDLTPGTTTTLANTDMSVVAFPLAHSGTESTAFLIEHRNESILCFGDTGSDVVEKSSRLHEVWTAVAQRVKQKQLKAIIIETSYSDDRPQHLLFGHLTPVQLMNELRSLNALAGGNTLRNVPVVISHIKFSLRQNEAVRRTIRRELESHNDIGVKLIIPAQGDSWRF